MSLNDWKQIPPPHQLFAALFMLAQAMKASAFFPSGSTADRALDVIVTFAGLCGISAARMYLSPQVIAKLERTDNERVEKNAV